MDTGFKVFFEKKGGILNRCRVIRNPDGRKFTQQTGTLGRSGRGNWRVRSNGFKRPFRAVVAYLMGPVIRSAPNQRRVEIYPLPGEDPANRSYRNTLFPSPGKITGFFSQKSRVGVIEIPPI
jgi:hypothetical protein